jgi:hypothetical protein
MMLCVKTDAAELIMPAVTTPGEQEIWCCVTEKINRARIHREIIDQQERLFLVWKFCRTRLPVPGMSVRRRASIQTSLGILCVLRYV